MNTIVGKTVGLAAPDEIDMRSFVGRHSRPYSSVSLR